MNKPKIDFAVGGQALIEGILMRSPNFNIYAVRRPDKSIFLESENYRILTQKLKFLNLPVLRGVINFFEMMLIGTKAINLSSQIAFAEPNSKEKSAPIKKTSSLSLVISVVFALLMSILFFKFTPLLITQFLSNQFPSIAENPILFNIIDGVIKISLFVGYISLLNLFKDIRRVFMYHGAEHKAIFTYEKGLDLTVDNARAQTRFHPRCGTSFILVVFLISIVVYTLLPKMDSFLLTFGLRVLFLPIIAGISYEFLKLASKHDTSKVFNLLSLPGLALQRLTTKEPTDDILEIAVTSLKQALSEEEKLMVK